MNLCTEPEDLLFCLRIANRMVSVFATCQQCRFNMMNICQTPFSARAGKGPSFLLPSLDLGYAVVFLEKERERGQLHCLWRQSLTGISCEYIS